MKLPRQNRLVAIAIVMMVVGLALSAFTLWYMVVNQKTFEAKLQQNLNNELAKYNLPDAKDITADEAQLYLAVAKFCEANNNCQGPKGDVGASGVQGIEGLQGLVGATGLTGSNGLTPPCYFTESQCQGRDGEQGASGTPARNIERRCNPEQKRVEWRLEGDTAWSVEYYLSPLQTCEGGI